jgi:hypothetical protein
MSRPKTDSQLRFGEKLDSYCKERVADNTPGIGADVVRVIHGFYGQPCGGCQRTTVLIAAHDGHGILNR